MIGLHVILGDVNYDARAIEIRKIIKEGLSNSDDKEAEKERVIEMIERLETEDTWESLSEALALWKLYQKNNPGWLDMSQKPQRESRWHYLRHGRLGG